MSDDRLSRIENKVDNITEKLSIVDKELAIYNELLKIHIKRTDQNSEQLTLLKKFINDKHDETDLELEPIKTHILLVGRMFKIGLAILGAAATIITIISKA